MTCYVHAPKSAILETFKNTTRKCACVADYFASPAPAPPTLSPSPPGFSAVKLWTSPCDVQCIDKSSDSIYMHTEIIVFRREVAVG